MLCVWSFYFIRFVRRKPGSLETSNIRTGNLAKTSKPGCLEAPERRLSLCSCSKNGSRMKRSTNTEILVVNNGYFLGFRGSSRVFKPMKFCETIKFEERSLAITRQPKKSCFHLSIPQSRTAEWENTHTPWSHKCGTTFVSTESVGTSPCSTTTLPNHTTFPSTKTQKAVFTST